ncbi:MAG: hypothetical protein K6F79_06940 [Saccharofermentans sp.]|nr:hypothetical protein [Saccharofermentans sp.]
MLLTIECLIGVLLFTLIVVPMDLKNPLGVISDYPPAIRKRCIELGLCKETEKRFSVKDIIRKTLAVIILIALAVLVLVKINHAQTFLQGFGNAMVIWLSITWFDALVIDCLWFCHSRRMKIPGTEDMEEYKDYLFHIKQSCIGTLIGLPACALIGLLVMLLS